MWLGSSLVAGVSPIAKEWASICARAPADASRLEAGARGVLKTVAARTASAKVVRILLISVEILFVFNSPDFRRLL